MHTHAFYEAVISVFSYSPDISRLRHSGGFSIQLLGVFLKVPKSLTSWATHSVAHNSSKSLSYT